MTEEFKLKPNYGFFEIRGKVFGTKGKNGFIEKDDTGFRMCNIGLRVSESETVFVGFTANKPKSLTDPKAKDNKEVYWSGREGEGKNAKTVTMGLPYGKTPDKDGYRPIGVSVKLEQDGEVQYLCSYDAWDYLRENLQDDTSVFVKGKVEFSSWQNKDGDTIKGRKFVINSIYIAKQDIDFEAENFEKHAFFNQDILFLGVEKPEKGQEFATVEFGVVTWNGYEVTTLPIVPKVAKALKNNVRPYGKINVNGDIEADNGVVEVEVDDDDEWGTGNKVGVQNKKAVAKMVVRGADPNSIDEESYDEKTINAWVKQNEEKKNKNKAAKPENFKSQDDFGTAPKFDEEDDAW